MINRAKVCRGVEFQRAGISGFSLVELMVSLTIGLIIIGALVALLVNTSRSNRELARANSLIESGSVAIQILEDDVVHAGFWGPYVPGFDDLTLKGAPTDAPTAEPDPCLAYDPADWDAAYQANIIGITVQAYEMPNTLVAPRCSDVIEDPVANTDILIVRHAETCIPGEATAAGTCEAQSADKLYFQASTCTDETPLYVLGKTGFVLNKRDCAEDADVRRFVSHIYYVRDYAVTEGDGIPTLVRSSFDFDGVTLGHQPVEPLVQGIQAFRVELGVDDLSKTGAAVDYAAEIEWEYDDPDEEIKDTPVNRGDGVPDGEFVRCSAGTPCTWDQFMNTTAVRLFVLSASRDETPGYVNDRTYVLGSAPAIGPFNDGLKRHVFSTTVRLPNVAGRRTTP